jgi:hypothetical protein
LQQDNPSNSSITIREWAQAHKNNLTPLKKYLKILESQYLDELLSCREQQRDYLLKGRIQQLTDIQKILE